MEFPTTRPRKLIDDYMEQERRRAIVETLAWAVGAAPELPEDFFKDIPPDIHEDLCKELELRSGE